MTSFLVRRAVAVTGVAVLASLLVPAVTASAVPITDCSATLASAAAASDSQPGYTAHLDTTTVDGTAASGQVASDAGWNAAQGRASVSSKGSLTITIDGATITIPLDFSGVVATNGDWLRLADFFPKITPEIHAALVLLHKPNASSLFSPRRLTAAAVQASGAKPSADLGHLLATPLPVTGTANNLAGGLDYTCSDASRTVVVTLDGGGLVVGMSYVGPAISSSSGSSGVGRAGLMAASRRAHPAAVGGTETDTLTYDYKVPLIAVPSPTVSVTLRDLARAVESTHLRSEVRAAALHTALAANAGVGSKHRRVTATDVRRIARVVVRSTNGFMPIRIYVTNHHHGVWITAVNPFTHERFAYQVQASAGRAKVTKIH